MPKFVSPVRSSQLLNLAVGAAIVAVLSIATVATAADAPRPNVVLFMADDLGYECIGANGCTSYQTPHLDGLAARGARFEHCYVQPLCTPTRAQLMTGQYNVRNYIRFGLLDPELTTFGNLFRDAGYATCIVGKWQLGSEFSLPGHFGFDEYCLWQLTRRPGRYKNPGLEINGKEFNYDDGEYGPQLINDYAVDFISRSKDKPFFLYYPMILTHDPYNATPDSEDYATAPYEGQKDGKAGGKSTEPTAVKYRHFGEMVEYMDKMVGNVLKKLNDEGLAERTLVIFIGDNGTGKGTPTKMGERTVIGGKGTADDSGMHVPMIVGGYGVKPGIVVRDLVDGTDFLPSICDAAGITIPSDLTLDGRSFYPQCKGETGTPRDWIYCWYARNGGKQAESEFARDHRFKLGRDGQLFDVSQGDRVQQRREVDKPDESAQAARVKLQAVLDCYADARPERIKTPGAAGKAKE